MSGILKNIYISKSRLFVDGKLVLQGESSIFVKFLKEVYKHSNMKYPKYYKMDALSKLGFIASEILLKDFKLSCPSERIGVVFGNSISTYIVDSKHQETINDKENYFPSPANFVYTLPNVMTGEICIRNGFKGENAVFISEGFDHSFISDYIQMIYKANKADLMIGGYVDVDEDSYEAFIFITDKNGEQLKDEIENIYTDYKTK